MPKQVPNYTVEVHSPQERSERIRVECEGASEHRRFFHFRDTSAMLPVIRLSVDWLIYRIANARTRDEQLDLEARGKYETGYFDPSKQEDADLQQVQHAILFDFAQTGQGETVYPIFDELSQKRVQTEPILITAQGVVVNGNRRLAAMRELALSGKDGLETFSHVDCMVLPAQANDDDLLTIEFKLQMTHETKLPYTWTNEARICKTLQDQGRPIAAIAKLRDDDEKHVTTLIQMYQAAERYLNEWLERPGEFHLLDETRQAFSQMVTRRSPRRPQDQKEAADAFGFFLIEKRESLEDRAYRFINAVENDPPTFFKHFAATVELDLVSSDELATGDSDPLLVDFSDGDPTEGGGFQPIIDYLKSARADEASAQQTIEAIQTVSELIENQKKDPGAAALKLSKGALQKINAIDCNGATTKVLGELCETLKLVSKRANEIIEQVSTAQKPK